MDDGTTARHVFRKLPSKEDNWLSLQDSGGREGPIFFLMTHLH